MTIDYGSPWDAVNPQYLEPVCLGCRETIILNTQKICSKCWTLFCGCTKKTHHCGHEITPNFDKDRLQLRSHFMLLDLFARAITMRYFKSDDVHRSGRQEWVSGGAILLEERRAHFLTTNQCAGDLIEHKISALQSSEILTAIATFDPRDYVPILRFEKDQKVGCYFFRSKKIREFIEYRVFKLAIYTIPVIIVCPDNQGGERHALSGSETISTLKD